MSNDDFFTAINEWIPVQVGGADITNGIFSVFSHGNNRVGFFKSDTLPTAENGPAYFSTEKQSLKYNLLVTEKLYCKAIDASGSVEFGVIPG